MNTEKSLGGSTEKGYRGSTKRGFTATRMEVEITHRVLAGGRFIKFSRLLFPPIGMEMVPMCCRNNMKNVTRGWSSLAPAGVQET